MSIIWFNEKPKDAIATLYEGNITLNKPACSFMEHAYSVMLGLDVSAKMIVIKPLSKELDQRGDIPANRRYKITLRSSYGRISNKSFMQEIEKLAGIDLTVGAKKYPAEWDDKEHVLRIDLKEGLE